MMSTAPNLSSLSRGPGRSASAVVQPPSRWKTRVLLPLAIVAALLGLLGYSARSVLRPTIDVWVVPVVAKAGGAAVADSSPQSSQSQAAGATGSGSVLAQAPGWIEADPYPISVPALAEGVVREVLVLEGQSVEAGQVVARLVEDDARLAAQLADAELGVREGETQQAKAAVAAAEARAEEVRDEVNRKRPLATSGGVSEGQLARLEIRVREMEREVESARGALATAEAAMRTHLVMCEQARLAVERTEIRSPAAGVVMARLVEPGSRISMASRGEAGGMAGAVVRLYDPARLQVRVDVPLADVAKIGVGTEAQVSTEALPDRIFHGTVTRIVHEANIQRNTVQVKVAIKDPVPTLKPEMLTRVRFYGVHVGAGTNPGTPLTSVTSDQGTRLIVPIAALLEPRDGRAKVWLVEQSSARIGSTVARREVTIAPGSERSADGYAEVTSGLRAGDRLVVEAPASLTDGVRVRVRGEHSAASSTEGGR